MSRLVHLALVVSLSACGSGVLYAPWAPTPESGWLQDGGNPQGDRLRSEGVEPPLRLLWQQSIGDPPLGSPLLAGPLVLQWSKAPDLLVFDAATGHRVGRKRLNDPVCGPPAIAGTRAHLMLASVLDGDEPQVRALDLTTGDVAWRLDGSCSAVVVRGDTAFLAQETGRLQAVDVVDGSVLWSVSLPAPLTATPSLYANLVVLPTGDGKLVAARVDSGTVAWKRAVDPRVRLRVAADVSGTRVFAVSDGRLQALSLATGDTLWSAAFRGLPGGVYASKSTVVLGSTDYGVYAFDAETGMARWRTELGGIVRGAPVGTEDIVYAGAADGWLYAIDATDGSVRWRHQLDGPILTSAALTEHLLVATTERGTTFVFTAR